MPDSGGEADLFVLVDITHIRLMCFFSAPTYPVKNNFTQITGKGITSQCQKPHTKADVIMSQCH